MFNSMPKVDTRVISLVNDHSRDDGLSDSLGRFAVGCIGFG